MKSENILRIKKIAFMLGTVAMAFAAGAAGAAIAANSFAGALQFSSASVPAAPAVRASVKPNAANVALVAKSTLTLYKKKTGATPLDRIYLPNDAVGSGVVLTSDGWIIVSSAELVGRGELVALLADKTSVAFDASAAVHDEATGLSFVKISARDLPVASFGDDTALAAGDPVFSVDPEGVISAAVLAQRTIVAETKADYVESTERLSRRITVSRSGAAGAAAANAAGDMIGIDMGDGTLVPAAFVTEVLRGLFTNGKVIRPNVGAHFVSLDGLPNAREAGLPAAGAYVTGGGKLRATEKGSAAEAAGLKEGDVITFVEHDRINGEESLAERLQDYAPGAKVELTVNRAGKEQRLELTLK